jgi:hypothetical protein
MNNKTFIMHFNLDISEKQKRSDTLLAVSLAVIITFTILIGIAIVLGLLLLKLDYLYHLAPNEEENVRIKWAICLGIRLLFLTLGFSAFWQMIIDIIIITIMNARILHHFLSKLSSANICNTYMYKMERRSRFQWVHTLSSCKLIKLHKEINILVQMISEAYSIISIVLILSAMIFMIVCNCVTIKLRGGAIPLPMYISFPLWSTCNAFCFMMIFPTVVKCHETSKQFLQSATLFRKNRYWQKIVKAERPIRVEIGPFFYAKQSTTGTMMAIVVDYTVNFILML